MRTKEIKGEVFTLEQVAQLPAVISVFEAAKVAGVSLSSITRACDQHSFACFKIGSGGRTSPWRIVTASFLTYCGLTDYAAVVRGAPAPRPASEREARLVLESKGDEPDDRRPQAGAGAVSREADRQERATAARQARGLKTMPNLITVDEASALLNKSRRSVWRFIQTGKLPAWKKDGVLVVRKRDVLNAFGFFGDGLPAADELPERISTKRASEISGRSAKTIYARVRNGEIGCIKRGREYLLDTHDVYRAFGLDKLAERDG